MAESNMITDLISVQKNLPSVKKTARGNYGTHLDLEEIIPKVLDVLNKNNFALLQPLTSVEGKQAIKTVLLHTSGEKIEDTMLLVLDKTTSQGQGSAITYARRYSLCSMLGLVSDKDDDGQRAEDETVKATAASAKVADDTDYDEPSEKQKDLMKDLMHKKGYEGIEAMAVSEQLIGKKIPKSKQDYSDLIKALINQDVPKKADKMPDLSE